MKKQQKRIIRRFVTALIVVAAFGGLIVFLQSRHFQILDARGPIARQQRDLLYFATALSLAVILPVFVLTWHIVRTYRVDSKKPKSKRPYQPEWDHNHRLEALWWFIPSAIILVLSTVTWITSHSLDPYKPIAASSATIEPLDVEVIALEWNWLFLYPEQGVASLNDLVIPADTPINFKITADAPMNSFWIPQLGGQVYAMSGMSSRLHLVADGTGTYRGSSANISGDGYADMNFPVRSVSPGEFSDWAKSVRVGDATLTASSYEDIRKPQRDRDAASFVMTDATLYQSVLDRYMSHDSTEDMHAHLN